MKHLLIMLLTLTPVSFLSAQDATPEQILKTLFQQGDIMFGANEDNQLKNAFNDLNYLFTDMALKYHQVAEDTEHVSAKWVEVDEGVVDLSRDQDRSITYYYNNTVNTDLSIEQQFNTMTFIRFKNKAEFS